MNKPQRQTHVDELTGPEIHNKKNDILWCIKWAQTEDGKIAYENQLAYVQKVIDQRIEVWKVLLAEKVANPK